MHNCDTWAFDISGLLPESVQVMFLCKPVWVVLSLWVLTIYLLIF